MRQSYRATLIGVVMLAAAVLSGCTSRLDTPFVDDGFFVNLQARSSLDIVGWAPKLSSQQRYVPVHPADGGPGAGGVQLDLDGYTTAGRIGLAGSFGTKNLRLYLGADARFNPNSDDNTIDDFDDDDDLEFEHGNMRDIEKQPAGTDSWGYAWITTSEYTYIPYVGLEAEFGPLIIGFEYGVPHTEFRYQRGHYRNGTAEILEDAKWEDFGQSASMKLGCRILDNHAFFGLQYSLERYEAEFSGEDTTIKANVFGILFELRF